MRSDKTRWRFPLFLETPPSVWRRRGLRETLISLPKGTKVAS